MLYLITVVLWSCLNNDFCFFSYCGLLQIHWSITMAMALFSLQLKRKADRLSRLKMGPCFMGRKSVSMIETNIFQGPVQT